MPSAENDLRVGRHSVRPLRRHRAHPLVVNAQQKARAVAVVPLANADELLSLERVEGMGYAHKPRA